MIKAKEKVKELYAKKCNVYNENFKVHLVLFQTMNPAFINSITDYVNMRLMKSNLSMTCIHRRKIYTLLNKQLGEKSIVCKHKFYTRVSNLMNTKFSDSKINILNKGLKYNVCIIYKNQIVSEIVNAEAVIKSLLNNNLQNEMGVLVNNEHLNSLKIKIKTIDKHLRVQKSNMEVS